MTSKRVRKVAKKIGKLNSYYPGRKYNWAELKIEFMQGPWPDVTNFLKDKEMMKEKKSPYIEKMTRGWAKEKKEMQEKTIQIATEKMIADETQDINKIRKRQANLARWMQLKGAAVLKDAKEIDPESARKLVVAGLKEERAALGIVGQKGGGTSLTQVNVNLPRTRLDEIVEELDYEGILRLVAELRRERASRTRVAASKEGATEAELAEA